jgi:transposase
MAKPLVDDELWELIQPLLPPKPRRWRYPGRKPLSDRQALTGILFVLKSGIPWEMLPKEMECGSGMTCWRRLRHLYQCHPDPLEERAAALRGRSTGRPFPRSTKPD